MLFENPKKYDYMFEHMHTPMGPFEAKMLFFCQISYCFTCAGRMLGTQSLKWQLYSFCFCVVFGTSRADILQADTILDHSHHSVCRAGNFKASFSA